MSQGPLTFLLGCATRKSGPARVFSSSAASPTILFSTFWRRHHHHHRHHHTAYPPNTPCSVVVSMTWTPQLRPRVIRLRQWSYRRDPSVSPIPATWRCFPRCSSTSTQRTIAQILSTSQPSLPSSQAPQTGETLLLNGFVRTVRKQKRVAFAAIGDGSSLQTVQTVLTPEQANGSVHATIRSIT